MRVKVHKGFQLTRNDRTIVPYAAGEQEMPEADARHWFAKGHLEVLTEPEPVEAPRKGRPRKEASDAT